MSQPPGAAQLVAVQLSEELGSLVDLGCALAPFTTYRVGGPAAVVVRVNDDSHLEFVARAARESDVEVLVMGRGSNILVSDEGFDGVVVMLGETYSDITFDETLVSVGAGLPMPVAARRTSSEGLTGFEWAVGIPGTVGGAVRMNAGGHGSDMSNVLQRVRVFDVTTGEHGWVKARDLRLGYRSSNIGPGQVVTRVELGLEVGDADRSSELINEIVRWRRDHQPGGSNAGSVFKNPSGDHAARLIEEAGCKGLSVGSAHVSERHANFIQVADHGRAEDVIGLMDAVRRAVQAKFGVLLEPETRLVGFRAGSWEDPAQDGRKGISTAGEVTRR